MQVEFDADATRALHEGEGALNNMEIVALVESLHLEALVDRLMAWFCMPHCTVIRV